MKTPFGTESAGDAPQRKRRWTPLVIGGVVVSLLVGGAFAASITVNTGNAIEFGQGQAQVTTCAVGDLTPTIASAFVPSPGGPGAFASVVVTLSGIPSGCDGKWIRIGLYDANPDPLADPPIDPTIPLDQILFNPVVNDGTTSFTLSSSHATGCGPNDGSGVSTCGPTTDTYDGAYVYDPTAGSALYSTDQVTDFTVESFDSNPGTTV